MLGQNIDIIVLRLKLLAQLGTSIKLEEMYYIILKNYIYVLNIYVFVLFLLGVLNTQGHFLNIYNDDKDIGLVLQYMYDAILLWTMKYSFLSLKTVV